MCGAVFKITFVVLTVQNKFFSNQIKPIAFKINKIDPKHFACNIDLNNFTEEIYMLETLEMVFYLSGNKILTI
jgi:hypothetical protein